MGGLIPFCRKAFATLRGPTSPAKSAGAAAGGLLRLSPPPPAGFLSAGYEPVMARHSEMRRAAAVETRGEDWQLPAAKRLRLTNLLRDMLRNSPAFVMQNRQMLVNVVGPEGGKLYASFPDSHADAAREVMDYFNREWAPNAEFTFGRGFNWLLKTALTAMDVGGNVALVFDDGILTGGDGTGRIRAFEGDEIADVPNLSDHFPDGWTQSQGFVYDPSGVFRGAFVSTSQRGRTTFDPSAGVLVLRRDPGAAPGNWTMLGEMARFNQGRAVSALASSLISLIDLHETVSSEALAAKFSAQLVAQIVHDTDDAPARRRGGFDGEGEGEGDVETVKVEKSQALRNIGLHTQDMPHGSHLEMLDTKRPNAALDAYVDFVLGLAGGARGFARVYSTLKAQTSYTAFRGEQIMTWKVFRDMQKELERAVCDWAARCAVSRAVRLGLIRSALPDGWERMVAWTWPKMAEVSERDAEAARLAKLQNGVTSLTRELGPGEFARVMAERAAEKRLFDRAGLVYPGETSVSGAVKGVVAEDEDGTEETEERDHGDE